MGFTTRPVEAISKLRAAREAGDVDEGPLSMGQDAGLIHDIPSASELMTLIASSRPWTFNSDAYGLRFELTQRGLDALLSRAGLICWSVVSLPQASEMLNCVGANSLVSSIRAPRKIATSANLCEF